MPIVMQVHGFAELRKKLKPELYAEATRYILDYAGGRVASTARGEAKGFLKEKVNHKVSRRPFPRSAVVYVGGVTNAGVRVRAIHGPVYTKAARTKPHTPRVTPDMRAWAASHGIPVSAVVLSVRARGTAFQPFLRTAREKNRDAVNAAIPHAEAKVKGKWAHG